MRVLCILVITLMVLSVVGCGPKKPKPPEEELEEARRAEKEAEKIPKLPEHEREPIQPTRPEVINLGKIHFEFDKYDLTEESKATLSENGRTLMKHSDIDVLIEGHCDERGTDEYNLALGEKRALASRDFLVNFGISKSRISVISYGEERPLDHGHNEQAWTKNRRAEFVIRR